VVELLINEGIDVKVGEQVAENIPENVSKIIYTIAVSESNPEFIKAKELEASNGIVLMSYPQALGEMSRAKNVISICGTHGKTTTTAMTYFALKNAGLKVSMIVGSLIEMDGKKTNYVNGGEDFLIIESCEYRRSFLNYEPKITLVTNIDNDHLDYFKNFDDVKNAFQEFVNKTEKAVIIHNNESFLEAKTHVEKIICEEFSDENDISLSVPGQHNRKNAQLVVALGEYLKLDKQKVLEGLKNFKGTWRRQEYKGNFFGADFYDDYGHHPTEVKATLAAFREKFADKKILAVFQPHLFSRTKLLFTDFVNSFESADEVVVLPIYPSREAFDPTISSGMLVEELKKIGKLSSLVEKSELKKYLENNISENHVVVTLGAGNIYDIYHELSDKVLVIEDTQVLTK
jgi:UDP-N-acetylmuramate--alanine ligase